MIVLIYTSTRYKRDLVVSHFHQHFVLVPFYFWRIEVPECGLKKFFFKLLKLFIDLWLCWVFIAVRAFSSYNEWGPLSSRGAWAARFAGFSCCRARAVAAQVSVVAACGLSGCDSQALEYPVARGTFPNQESNLCPLHRQVDSSPLEVPLNVVSTCTLQLIHEIKLLFPCLLTV